MKQEKQNIVNCGAPKNAPPQNPAPWNEWLRLARQGDNNAARLFCAQAEPFIERLCSTCFFRDRLGTEEIRSVAMLAVMEFLMTHPEPPCDQNLPYLLKRIIRNRVLTQITRQSVHDRRNQSTDANEEENRISNVAASRNDEPDAKLLAAEFDRAFADAFRQLRPGEKNMLRSFFFQNKTAAAIAKELQCSRQYVEKMRNKALIHLRKLLKGYHIFNDGAFSC